MAKQSGTSAGEGKDEDIRDLYAQMQGKAADESDLGRNGIQWQNVAPVLGLFLASAAIAFALGDSSRSVGSRAVSALDSAGVIFVGTLLTIWFFSRFVHHSRLSSRSLFLVVWAVAMAIWLLIKLGQGCAR